MCGINGILAYGPGAPEPDEREALRVRDAMASRGPDGQGLYRDPEAPLLLGHRRLEIIDLSAAGAQPMASAGGDLVITYNGEIYNYRQLRAELEAGGARFASASDTEVLLHLYRRRGEAMVDRLEGMFAFALWDRRRRRLLLARDPHGIKPLYYADGGGSFRFASSVRALLAGGGVSRDPDPRGVVGFLAWGSVPEPGTICRAVRALPAGSVLGVTLAGPGEPRRYWSPAEVYAGETAAPGRRELEEHVREALRESVRRHLVADVPVGLFLSAGVDSGTLLALAAELGEEPPATVTLAFEEFRGRPEDEAPLAAAAARRYGARHETVMLGAAQVRADLDRFLQAMDQPTVDGLNVYWISRAARETGLKTALSGLGGDELFGGYPTFRNFRGLRRAAALARLPGSRLAGRRLARLATPRRRAKARYLPEALASPAATYHLLRGLLTPPEIGRLLDPQVLAAGGQDSCAQVRTSWAGAPSSAWIRTTVAEQSIYMRNQLLRDADWASMSHGLEVRLPLVDRKLTAAVGPLIAATGGRYGKTPLARSPARPLPEDVAGRTKTGFGLPMQAWLAEDCRAGRLPRLPAWLVPERGRRFVERLAGGVARGRIHWSRIWALRVLEHQLRELA